MSVFLPKGTRDLLPAQMRARLALLATLREVFARFGFEPLETPAMERIETLTGKYGDEGDKLIFRILKRGEGGERGESDLALRYDLTVPLARMVAMHPELPMPFKRYQIQPVWRADRPQRGRLREFYQCDADTVGCADLSADAECVAVAYTALRALGFEDFTTRLNHRAVLRSICAAIGAADREASVLIAVDKLDKIGREGVSAELGERGLPAAAIDRLWGLLEGQGEAALEALDGQLDAAGRAGLAELREVLRFAFAMGVSPANLRFDPTLARGLDYYTGPVYETVLNDGAIGSVSAGGRYDGLVGRFSGRQVPAVGVSLGFERLAILLEERGLLRGGASSTEVLVTVFDEPNREPALRVAAQLRAAGVPTQVTLERGAKLGKQLKHADALGVRWAVVIGPEEARQGLLTLKELGTGAQHKLSAEAAVAQVLAARGG